MIEDWPVERAAAAVVGADGRVLGAHGQQDHVFELASVTKLLTAYAALIAVEEGAVEWDQPAGPPGSTLRHLVSHASGLAFNEHKVMAPPGSGGCTRMPGSRCWRLLLRLRVIFGSLFIWQMPC